MFDRPLQIWRPKLVPAGAGGSTRTFARVSGCDPGGKVDQPNAAEQLVAAQSGAMLTHSVYFEGLVDVRRGDELRDPAAGEAFKVLWVVRPSKPVYTKANCEVRQYAASEGAS